MKEISLNGKWHLSGTAPDGESKELTAEVPGHVHLDLEREGIIPPVFWRDNADKCQWVEDWDWTYTREFDIPVGAPLDTALLEFEGLDTFATVSVNGVELGKAEDMFIVYRFELAGVLHEGTNTVTVSFDAIRRHTDGKPCLGGAFTHDRGYVRRMQCTFYWDWVERLVSYGIWRPVTVCFREKARVENISLLTRDLAPSSASLQVIIETDYSENYLCREQLEILAPDGKTVWCDSFEVWSHEVNLQCDIREPELWWPNGYGKQPLYTARVTLMTPESDLIEVRERRFGIRTVRVEQLQDLPGSREEAMTEYIHSCPSQWTRETDRIGQSFTLLVNGRRIFCTGGNWVPCDPFPSRITKERYDTAVRLAKGAGMNMLRSWGGGIYEPEEFFDACDREGILITQDFIFGCMSYPTDAEFYALVRREVTGQIKRLRTHPSLAWWTGNNEDSMCEAWDKRHCVDRVLTTEVIEPIVRALDPTRPFFPTSPFGGNSNLDNTRGDSHTSLWQKWEDEADYRECYRRAARFESEHTVCGTVPKHSLLKFMSEEDLTDPTNRIFEFHDKSFKDADPTLFMMLERHAKAQLGEYRNAQDRLLKLEYVQYETVRMALESRRRLKWYNGGILFWMYNDCWPAVGWSFIGYDLIPKAAWYACRRANRQVIASIADTPDHKTFEFHVLNNGNADKKGTMTVSVVSGNTRRELLKKSFVSLADRNAVVAATDRFDLADNEVLICELSGEVNDTAVYYPRQRIAEVDLGTARVSYHTDRQNGTVTFTSDGIALCVCVEGDILLDDNYFNIYPGQTKTVSYHTVNGFTIDDAEFYCLNGTIGGK